MRNILQAMTARGGLSRLVHALRHSPWYPIRIIGAHPRLFICLAIGIGSYFLLPDAARLISRLLISWNLATISFLASIALMMSHATPDTIRRNAALYDEGQNAILGLASLASIACLAAIIIQLGLVKESTGLLKAFHLGLALTTILTAWAFIHVMFALHYAHDYFDESRMDNDSKPRLDNDSKPQLRGGLEILGSDTHPDYLDFAYYAFTIAVANATADINITSRAMRRITLVHSVLSFYFNLAVLGLTINIAASLI